MGQSICATEELFNPTNKFFIIDEMTVNVKGTLKVYLPTKNFYPLSSHWIIKQSNLQAVTTENRIALWSKKCNILSDPEVECRLYFAPNGDNAERQDGAWIFLHLQFENISKVKAAVNFTFDSANFSCDFEEVYEKTESWGFNICSTEDLFKLENQYFVDGEMTIKITGSLLIEKEKSTVVYEEEAGKKLSAANDSKDFTISVKEKSIKVSKQVLLDASPYFVGMFNSGMIEATEMKTTITDFDCEIVEAGIQILYDPKIPTNFTFEQMLELLRFSDKYDITVIKELIHSYFIKNLSATNVCSLLNFTTTTVSAPKLHSKCIKYIFKCSKETKAIHGLETLDKDLVLKIFMQTFSKAL